MNLKYKLADAQLKADVSELTDCLAKLCRLRGVEFQWKGAPGIRHCRAGFGAILSRIRRTRYGWIPHRQLFGAVCRNRASGQGIGRNQRRIGDAGFGFARSDRGNFNRRRHNQKTRGINPQYHWCDHAGIVARCISIDRQPKIRRAQSPEYLCRPR